MNSNLHKFKISQHYFAIFASVLLLLSSCTVKQNLADVIGIGFEKPLNPSKAAGSAASCSYAEVKTNTVVSKTVKQQFLDNENKFSIPVTVPVTNNSVVNKSFQSETKIPLYILYKKLKFDMA